MNLIVRMLITTVLALLIWAWAEGEGLSSAPATPRLVFAVPSGSDLAARVVEPGWNSTVTVALRGSNASIGAAQRVLLSPMALTPGVGAFPSVPGPHRLDLREVLRNSPEIRRTGVSIMSVEPATLDVRVDQLISKPAAVRLRTRGGELAQPAVVSPEVVMLRFPADVEAKLPGTLEVDALLDLSVVSMNPGAKVNGGADARVPISIPGAWRELGVLEPSPSVVNVSFTRGTPSETITLPSVPVVVVIDPTSGASAAWQVELIDSHVRDVRISGPGEAIARLREGKVQARAVGVVTDAEAGEGERQVVVTISTGAPGARADDADRVARVRVVKRN